MPGPLQGLRVLDLSRILAGPWSTQLLADFGADVLKIERPGSGDDTRGWGPPYLAGEDGSATPEAAYFLAANRGKRSLTVNIGTPQGQAIVRQLVQTSDVLVENYKFGDMARYGLDYASLSALNPRLIYCSITGFGHTGPYRERPGYDFVIQAMGGLMSITGLPDGEPGGGAMKCGVPIADMMTGMYAATAVLAAVQERHASGQGQHIDMSLLDVQVAWLANQASNYLVSGRTPQRLGNAHPNLAPYQTFRASDAEFIVAVGNDRQFRELCTALDLPALAEDPRYASNSARVAQREALAAALGAVFLRKGQQHWLACLTAAGVPCGPVHTIPEALADPQVASRGMLFKLRHANGAEVPQVANPVKFSRSSIEYRRAPPALGEHTEELLAGELGFTPQQLQQARNEGTV